MLVKTDEDYKELAGYWDNPVTPYCFHCSEGVTPPMIVWSGICSNGSTTYIQFHLNCAAAFQLLFARDLYEFKQSTGKVLIFDASPEESRKAFEAYEAELRRDRHRFQLYNNELAVPEFDFIDGGSEKVHIQEKGWYQTRCGHHFKQVRILKERVLDSDEVCFHCYKQGGVKMYPTGRFYHWDDDKKIFEDEVTA